MFIFNNIDISCPSLLLQRLPGGCSFGQNQDIDV